MTTDDQLSSSAYHVLTSLHNTVHSNTINPEKRMMIDRLMSILNDPLDDAQQCKDSFNHNSMQPILFDVLADMKQRHGRRKVHT